MCVSRMDSLHRVASPVLLAPLLAMNSGGQKSTGCVASAIRLCRYPDALRGGVCFAAAGARRERLMGALRASVSSVCV